jgi:hypothetical protein
MCECLWSDPAPELGRQVRGVYGDTSRLQYRQYRQYMQYMQYRQYRQYMQYMHATSHWF